MNINLDTDRFAVTLRFVMVAGLALLLLIPLALVAALVGDRQQYYREAVANIGGPWGGRQRLVGPVILIPLAKETPEERRRHVAIMPAELRLTVDAQHEVRQRGIFEAPVFEMAVTAEGRFEPLDERELRRLFGRPRMEQAAIAVGITDSRGIRAASFAWGDVDMRLVADAGPLLPGLRGDLAAVQRAAAGRRTGRAFNSAGAPPPPEPDGTFALNLTLRASERIAVVPVGDETEVEFRSSWPHPSFDGRFLPDAHTLDADDGRRLPDADDGEGFRALWTTSDLARGFPSIAELEVPGDILFADKDLGFSVFEPVNLYSTVTRSIKYGVLFVVLTLLSVLCLELATGRRFHAVQYGVGGLALVLFFVVLLALSEHIGFTAGYAAAAAVLTAMIGWYAHGSTREPRLALTAAGVLAVLYAVLYGLLRAEDFALLGGAVVLLAALAMLMGVTRRLTPAAAPKDSDGAS